VVYVSDRIVALCGTGWGQLGESGEYRMGRSESVPFDIRSSDGGSPLPVSIKDRSPGPSDQV
jgi:hypothetical protein